MSRLYGIPPRAYWQNEEFQRELKAIRAQAEALGWPEKVFQSPAEVAAWLKAAGLRPAKPVDARLVRRWCKRRRFPFTYLRGQKVKFLTTNFHVLAWLFTFAREHAYRAPCAKRSTSAERIL